MIGDLLVVAWVVMWIQIGRSVHAVVNRLGAPGRTLESAGTTLEDGLTSAGDQVSRLPAIGDGLAAPFTAAAGAAGSLTDAGIDLQQGVSRAALVAALAVAFWPVVLVVAAWLRTRLRFAQRAATVRQLLADGADVELFALRALVSRPLRDLAAVSSDPAGDWRRQDVRTVRALAALELDALGVALPEVSPSR